MKCEICGYDDKGKPSKVKLDYFLGVICFCVTNKKCTEGARRQYRKYRRELDD